MNTQKFLPQCSVYSSAYESSWDVRENLQGRIFQHQRSDQATYVIYFLGQIGGKHLARGKSQMTISQFFFTRELASLKKIIVTLNHHSFQFSSVDQSCPTLCDPMNHSTPGLSITNSRSSLKLMSIELVMPSSYLILCRPLLLLPQIGRAHV